MWVDLIGELDITGHSSLPFFISHKQMAESGAVTVPWCICKRCEIMPSDVENQCCGNITEQCMSLNPVSYI